MRQQQVTNWLLAGILLVLGLQVWLQLDGVVQAETFRLDSCITQRIAETPQQYLHVVTHGPAESR